MPPYAFTRRIDGPTQTLFAAHLNELQAAIESLDPPSAGTTLAPIGGVTSREWRGATVRDIRDWYRDASGVVRTDIEVFRAMALDVAAAGGGAVAVTAKPTGDGAWSWPYEIVTTFVDLPSNIHLFGAGPGGGRFLPTGGATGDNSCMFRVFGPKQHGLIERLFFKGENGTDGTGFIYALNHQSNAIGIFGDTFSQGPNNWTVRDCRFADLHGFSVHSAGGSNVFGPRRIKVLDSLFTYCGNGVNLLGGDCQSRGNVVFNSEGFENGGRGMILANNIIIAALGTGLNVGGSAQDDGGGIVANNVLIGSSGEGMSVGDGIHDMTIMGNVVLGTEGYAFRTGVGFVPEFAPRNLNITGNIFRSTATQSTAFECGAPNSTVHNNHIGGSGQEPLHIISTGGSFTANTIDLGTVSGRAFQASSTGGVTATDNFFGGDNQYTPFAYFDGTLGVGNWRAGSAFRLTALPTASAQWRGSTVWITAAAGSADVYKMATKDAANAYAWRDLLV